MSKVAQEGKRREAGAGDECARAFVAGVACTGCGGGPCYEVKGLNTVPPVFHCRECDQLFTQAGGRAADKPNPRQVRRFVVARWQQLTDDFERLRALVGSDATVDAFEVEEVNGMAGALEEVWYELTNARPKLPPSKPRKAGKAVRRGR